MRLRVLHLPASIGGNAWNLARAETALGADSELLTIGIDNPYQFEQGRSLNIDQRTSAAAKFYKLARGFADVRTRYDVFHFNFGTTLLHAPRFGLNLADLSLYPRSAALFVTYNGCDARQKGPTMARRSIAACHQPDCYGGQCNSGRLDRQRAAAIGKMARYVDHMWVVNPDLLAFLPADKSSFLPYAISVGILDPLLPAATGPLRIAHAPSDRAAKGTRYIVDAITALQGRYPGAVEFDLIEGQPHEIALARLRACDLLVDQLLIGWYGGVAVEAMLLGKTVIAYIDESDRSRIPAAMGVELQGALISATADELYGRLERCLQDRRELAKIASRAIVYAKRWHAPEAVAAQTLVAYRRAIGERTPCAD